MKKAWPSWESIDRAARACGKRKRKRPDAIAFRACYGEEVLDLCERLRSGTYSPEPGTVFVTERPKTREIHAAQYRDRVVHHLLHDLIEPHFEKSFIKDSYACRKGKGSHAAVLALQDQMRQVTRNGKVRAYALHLDVKSFFFSIHKPTLLNILEAKKCFAGNDDLRRLTQTVINHNVALDSVRRGSDKQFDRIPMHKRLGSNGPERGLPIGNLTSQLFANIYLDVLDQMIKRTLGVKYYARYSDDFILLHTDPKQLEEWKEKIRLFLQKRLLLEIHEKSPIHPVSEGVDFVGYIIRPDYLLSRSRVVRHAQARITKLEKDLQPIDRGSYRIYPIRYKAIEALRASWASYLGHFKHANAQNLIKRFFEQHPISTYYLMPQFLSEEVVMTRRFVLPRYDSCWAQQKIRLGAGLERTILVVQVGCYAELPIRKDAKQLSLRRGLPFHRLSEIIDRAVAKGLSVALALEVPGTTGHVKPRQLAYFIEPTPLSESAKKVKQLKLPGFDF
ncbi:MAG: reverse transcriptase/maturase family protein [Myxococcaceae bacterium]